jgi:protein-disulfide isomerase
MKILTVLVTLLLSAVCIRAQKPMTEKSDPAAEATLPTKEELNAVLQRVYGYDPSIQWSINLIRKSSVPGMNEVFLKIKEKYQHLYITADGLYAINGDAMPFGRDPYALVRSKLSAAKGAARGPALAVLVMVEFSDLQCPKCKDAQPVIERLAADFPQMKIIFQHYPLAQHAWAMKAAMFADCAARMDTEAAWKFIASVYQNQGGVAPANPDDKLKELAAASGLDAAKVSSCAASPATEARVKESMALGDSVGVAGTPYIFVNGRLLDGVLGAPYEQVKAIVQYESDHAGK